MINYYNSMENTNQLKQDAISQASSELMIHRIMSFTHSGYSGHQNHALPLIQKFNVDYLTSLLDRNKIESIDKVYRSKEEGFNLLQFVRFFLNVIEHQEVETLYLTIALIDFFKEVSQSCGYKDRLHFIDITNYICNRILEKRNEENEIESKLIPDYRTVTPNFKIKDYLINPPKIYASKDELVYKLSLNRITIDKTKHEGVVTNCCFSNSLMKVFTLDDLSDSISIYNTNCQLIKKIKPNYFKMKKDIVVLAFAYSQRQERIGAVLKDFSINFWDNTDNFQFEKTISTASHCPQYQTNIWFFEYFNVWVTSDKTGYLYIWNLEKERPERKIKLAYETQVNDLAVIPCINLVAVVQERKIYSEGKGSMQRRKKQGKEQKIHNEQKNDHEAPIIYLYDYFKGEIVTKIELGTENRNPHTLQYSQNYQVLLSAGYEKKICVFQINKTYLDTSKKGELTGHESLITSFTILKKSPMVVSADDKGKVKIWDIRNFKCVQTLDFRDKTNITKLLDMIELGKIGVMGSRINFVEFDEKAEIQKKIQTKQKVSPLAIECDYSTEEIIMLTKKDVRIIDMRKGVTKSIYCQFHTQETEITFFKYFEALKKIVIGNQKGQIKLYCIRTGRLEGKLMGHNGSVTHIEYDQQNKIFITMGLDSNIQIQKQLATSYDQSQNKTSPDAYQISSQARVYKNASELTLGRNILAQVKSESKLKQKMNNEVRAINSAQNQPQASSKPITDANLVLLRQIKNNFYGKQLTLACVSIYHGFIAVGSSSEKTIYLWDYEFSKLICSIALPTTVDPNVEITTLAFINGYSILVVCTSQGVAYFLKISRTEPSIRVKTIGVFRSDRDEPITHIVTDLLIKGFSASDEKFVHCKVYLGQNSGTVTSINLSQKLSALRQEPSAVHKQSFNPERQLRENFVTEIQKKKYLEYTIHNELEESIFGQMYSRKSAKKIPAASQSGIEAVHFAAHKGAITSLTIMQLDDCLLITTGADEKIKIWRENQLVCDSNINLPLPFKWDLQVDNSNKNRDKIMFALKVIQQIFLKYGNDISINESKALKVRKLLDKVKQDGGLDKMHEGNFITEPNSRKSAAKNDKVILFQDQFTKKDMHYDYMKKFNFNEVAGPTLREIEVQKKLDMIQREWSINKEKVEEDKNKLLTTIRNRAQKNEEKDQILEFMEPRNHEFFKNKQKQKQIKDPLNSSPYVKNIMTKIQSVLSPKPSAMLPNQSGFGFKTAKQLMMASYQKSRGTPIKHKTLKSLEKIYKKQEEKPPKKEIPTFEKYFQQKENSLGEERISNSSAAPNQLKQSRSNFNLTSSSNFRNILTRMNERVKQSKMRKIRQTQDDDELINNQRFMSIATSEGKRSRFHPN